MGRKTYSFSALAVSAAATLSFTGIDGARAFAHETFASEANAAAPVANSPTADAEIVAEELVEIVPEPTVFTSQEVVQDIPEEPEVDVTSAGSLRELINLVDADSEMTEQMRCLAGAVYFESRGEPLDGQLAVAHVVINRSEDRRWPSSYCDVVYQRAQFSFVKNRRMPRIATNSRAWEKAKAVAKIAHEGLWNSPAEDAVYFHANYVSPRWSRAKTRLAQIDTHIFYR
ncbi:MAG: cell wall hydrolase [Erythrobacter sp.]|uniref:cell wall hydrolase n=1 Tax=Erythrobacter sp. TaxID=1042 RepID=UPI003C74842D